MYCKQITFICLILFFACDPHVSKGIYKLEDRPECLSALEGKYFCAGLWRGGYPVILTKRGSRYVPIFGEIIEEKADGVLFNPERQSPAYDPKPKLFRYDDEDVIAFINAENQLVYGAIPERYQQNIELFLYIRNVEQENSKQRFLKFEPNKRFGFCLAPGKYQIEKIRFEDKKNMISESLSTPNLFFTVELYATTYIGDLYLDFLEKQEHATKLPYDYLGNPKKIRDVTSLFGIAGAAIYALNYQGKKVAGFHYLAIEKDADFITTGKYPKKLSLLGSE